MQDAFAEYIRWRREHPTDDLMTELLNMTFQDDDGRERRLRDDELLGYIQLLAGAETKRAHTSTVRGWERLPVLV